MPQKSLIDKGATAKIVKWLVIGLVMLNIEPIFTKTKSVYANEVQKQELKKKQAKTERTKAARKYQEQFRAKEYTLRPGKPVTVELPLTWKISFQSDYPFKFRCLSRYDRLPLITRGLTDEDGWYHCADGRQFTAWELPNSHQTEAYEFVLWNRPGERYSQGKIQVGFKP